MYNAAAAGDRPGPAQGLAQGLDQGPLSRAPARMGPFPYGTGEHGMPAHFGAHNRQFVGVPGHIAVDTLNGQPVQPGFQQMHRVSARGTATRLLGRLFVIVFFTGTAVNSW